MGTGRRGLTLDFLSSRVPNTTPRPSRTYDKKEGTLEPTYLRVRGQISHKPTVGLTQGPGVGTSVGWRLGQKERTLPSH